MKTSKENTYKAMKKWLGCRGIDWTYINKDVQMYGMNKQELYDLLKADKRKSDVAICNAWLQATINFEIAWLGFDTVCTNYQIEAFLNEYDMGWKVLNPTIDFIHKEREELSNENK